MDQREIDGLVVRRAALHRSDELLCERNVMIAAFAAGCKSDTFAGQNSAFWSQFVPERARLSSQHMSIASSGWQASGPSPQTLKLPCQPPLF